MVSQVSTRGVKFKFSEGERVLCYEPDPTKAKVLYESKVLDLVVSRDERGRKVPEYLIHFFGWNSSWDRCVREEFILPYTEENSELQAKLASEAALTIKGKRKYKLPPLIKETLAKKQCAEEEKEKPEKSESPVDTSSSDSSDDDSEREVIINIPDVLKKQLDEDHAFITQKNKFVKLPCKPNVISILEAYVKHSAAKFLCVSPPKNAKNGQQVMPDDVKNKLNLCKEAMDGIRIYFDFTLPHLLLYRQEKKQHYTEGINCRPIDSSYVWEPAEVHETPVVKIEKMEDENIACNSVNSTPFIKMEQQIVLSKRSQNRKSPRNYSSKKKSTGKQENITNGETEQKSENIDQATEIKNIKTPKQRPKLQSTRVLRSSEKQKPQSQKEEPAPKPVHVITASPPVIIDNKQPQSQSELSTPDSSNPPRVTRKTTLQNMSPPRISSPTLPIQPSQPITEEKPVSSNSTPIVNTSRVLPPLPLPSNCISSSNSSSHSTFSNPKIGHQFHLINNATLLQEVLSWRLLPPHLYEPIPAAPSLIYGAQHLLRLFVKLPELLSKMNMSRKKLIPLLNILESLLQFIAEKKNELFHFSAYSDSNDEEHDKNVYSTK